MRKFWSRREKWVACGLFWVWKL